nr:MAG: DNA pilot protein [Microvirus sp.]
MPILPALIGAAAGVGSTLINAGSQRRVNRDQEAFAREMYNTQDERDLRNFHMTNEYNSPEAQMKRLKQAGLNPNLVYGSGSAVNTASSPAHSSAPAISPRAPEYDFAGPVSTYFDLRAKEAQVNNLEAMNTKILEETALTQARRIATDQDTTFKSEFTMPWAIQDRPLNQQALASTVYGKELQNEYQFAENERRIALHAPNLQMAFQRIAESKIAMARGSAETDRIRADISRISSDNTLKQLDIDLKRAGVQPHDHLFFRVLGEILQKTFGNFR